MSAKKQPQPGLTKGFRRGKRDITTYKAQVKKRGLSFGNYIYIDNKNIVSLKNIIAVKEKNKNKKTTLIILDEGEVLTNKSAQSIIKRVNSQRGCKNIYKEE